MDLITTLNWRYAVKKYSNEKVSEADLATILNATNLTASSVGIQPYRVFVLENQAIRKQLGESSFNAQIVEASHLLVFAAYDNVTLAHIEKYMDYVATVREIPREQLAAFQQSLEGFFLKKTAEENFQWAAKQAYIGLGTALVAAAALQVDSTPMEGFDSKQLDELLGLQAQGLKSVVLLSLGYRDAEKDTFAKMKKVRLPIAEFTSVIA